MSNPLRSCYFAFDDTQTWRGMTDDTYWNGSLKICHVDAATHAEITAYFRPEACPANAKNLAEFEAELQQITAADGSADYSQRGWTMSESTAPRYWARVFGLGYHPDTRGADYVNADGSRCLTIEEAARYDADHAAFDGDAYAEGISEWEFLGLLPTEGPLGPLVNTSVAQEG